MLVYTRVILIKMKLPPIIEFGNPALRQVARPVRIEKEIKTPVFRNLIKLLFFVTKQKQGVALAAPQLGKNIRLAVIEITPNSKRYSIKETLPKTVVINPRIISYSKSGDFGYEGSFSLPDVFGGVIRSKSVIVEYFNEKGEKVVRKVSGFLARAFQHEIDLLNGIPYIDRITDIKTLMTKSEYRKRILKISGK